MILFWLLIVILAYLGWRLFFLRNPKRKIPDGNVIVAPADGYVVYVKKIQKGEIITSLKKGRSIPLSELTDVPEINQNGTLVGIFMTPASVHRNRVPLKGKILFQKHKKNEVNLSMVRPFVETLLKRISLKEHEENRYLLTNERLTTGIETDRGVYFITQIADPWINRVVSFVKEGDHLETGEQYGMIRFGSQCDLFIPDSYGVDINVPIGTYLYAGESILAKF